MIAYLRYASLDFRFMINFTWNRSLFFTIRYRSSLARSIRACRQSLGLVVRPTMIIAFKTNTDDTYTWYNFCTMIMYTFIRITHSCPKATYVVPRISSSSSNSGSSSSNSSSSPCLSCSLTLKYTKLSFENKSRAR